MPFVERRHSPRTAINVLVTAWLPAAQRSFHGSCINLSKRGALIRLPLSSPIRQGQKIKLHIAPAENSDLPDHDVSREIFSQVIRVDRESSLHHAEIVVALAFDA